MEAQSRSGNMPRGQERNQFLRVSPLSRCHSKNGLVHVATEARYIHKNKRTAVLRKTLVAMARLTKPSLIGPL
jgi:hypothetical protein